MGDGSLNVLNKNLLFDFEGKGFEDKVFLVDVFILNFFYFKEGNGMIFVEKVLNMMNKGYVVVFI